MRKSEGFYYPHRSKDSVYNIVYNYELHVYSLQKKFGLDPVGGSGTSKKDSRLCTIVGLKC